MKYFITLSHHDPDFALSQYATGSILYKIGFTNIRWNMGASRKNGDLLHKWFAEGDAEMIMILKLSADVEKIEELR